MMLEEIWSLEEHYTTDSYTLDEGECELKVGHLELVYREANARMAGRNSKSSNLSPSFASGNHLTGSGNSKKYSLLGNCYSFVNFSC